MTFDKLDAAMGRIKFATQLPQLPSAYYHASDLITNDEWRGGELLYHNGTGTGANKLYIQSATSGKTPVWRTIATEFTTP